VFSLPLRNPPRRIAWFLTAHGFGHGVRASALLQALPSDVEVTLYTALPESFFKEELGRAFRVVACALDCGCVQRDSVEINVPATLARYAEIEDRRAALVSPLAGRLRDERVDLIIGDIPPLAFPLASQAGIPSLALCNFSWVDIYAPYVEAYPAYAPMLARMRRDYARADAQLRLFPHFGEALTARVEELGLVCRPGSPRKVELAMRLGLDPNKKWCLVYLGNYGFAGVAWDRLADFSDWEFMGLYPLTQAPNYHLVSKDPTLRYADLTASADLVLGKLGYGLVAECLTHGTPILFVGRHDFGEYPVLKQLVEERGLGCEIPLSAVKTLELKPYLRRAEALKPEKMAAGGTARFLEILGFPTG
jgi:L-arabinokinase